jgi:hypothetical protein
MTDLTIRPAATDDAVAVFGLLTQFVTSYQPDRGAFGRHFPRLIASGQAVFLVAESATRCWAMRWADPLVTLRPDGDVAFEWWVGGRSLCAHFTDGQAWCRKRQSSGEGQSSGAGFMEADPDAPADRLAVWRWLHASQ